MTEQAPRNVSVAPDLNRRGRAYAPTKTISPTDIERQRLVLESLDRVCKAAGISRSIAAALLGTSSSRLSQWRSFAKGKEVRPSYMMPVLYMKLAIWLVGRIRELLKTGELPVPAGNFGGKRNPKYALAVMIKVLPRDVDALTGI